MSGEIFGSIDVAQVTLYLFWFFFAALVIYLRGEDKREGYPLEEADASPYTLREGFPGCPAPKTFVLPHGGTRVAPVEWAPGNRPTINATPVEPWPGAPLEPNGNPMLAGVGPGSWANRPDECDLTIDGEPKLVPLRSDTAYSLDGRDPDPRGRRVIGADGMVGGTVTDIWVDRSERLFRYIELEVAGGRRVLLPVNFSRVAGDGTVHVASIFGEHFVDVPGTAKPDQVTMLEEEKIMAYYGAGTLYAHPSRLGPLI